MKKEFDLIKKLISERGIKNRSELFRKYSGIYNKFFKNLSKEEKDLLLPPTYPSYSYLNTKNDFKKFIEDNNITSRIEFELRFRNCYYRFLLLNDEERNNLLPIVNSSGELYLSELFTKNEVEFITEKTFPDLINVSHLRYDFFLPKYNILIEYHGSQHFNKNDGFYDVEAIERDKQKFEYAKKNNIPLLYFTNEVRVYKKFGYFTEVITDSDILIQKIKEIGLTNQLNS